MAQRQMKKLAKDTAIYGLSSIIGKFLNWCLVPLYTYVLPSSADYGIVTNLYAWTALLLVILTYGMETGFFRFANKTEENPNKVYGTTLVSIGTTSLLFAALCVIFSRPMATGMGYSRHPEFIAMLAVIVAMDAFDAIPFAYLRYKNRPIKFAALKLFMIFMNILFNIFFLVLCPIIAKKAPSLIDWFYNPNYGVGYIFVANLISTLSVTLALLPDIRTANFRFDSDLWKRMLQYSFPLLILGIAGILDQTVDKIIFPFLFEDKAYAASQLGIYGACFKISMVMMMFTQAFRYAYEPFIFAQYKDKDSKEAYAEAMKYFVIFSLLIFLGMVFYLDIFKFLIRSDYWEGLRVVPIVLFSYLFQGIFFNLSLWYKLTDKTYYGAIISIIGSIVVLTINILFVPVFSYMASAWASFACYFVMMLISYFLGQKYMPIKYDLKKMGVYTLLTLVLYTVSLLISTSSMGLNLVFNTILLIFFVSYLIKHDLPLENIPVVNRLFKKI
ncbi:MAG TPA: oligosaccharide flippase family protein [Paludibacteraceae bacterium]|nr:oligosaccharide flippase family protein [Paludibacteraceae bacterium]